MPAVLSFRRRCRATGVVGGSGHALRALAGLLLAAVPATAELEVEPPDDAGFSGVCTMTTTCNTGGRCGAMPVLGEVLLATTPAGAVMGRNDENLQPIDLYDTLDAAHPLPETDGTRREFLVRMAPGQRGPRFGLFVQIADPATGRQILSPRHYVLECLRIGT